MRYLTPLVVLVAIVAGLGLLKFKQISMLIHAGEAGQKAGPPPEVVGTAKAAEDAWEGTISAVGTVAAVRGVTVSADLPGVVDRISFESGQSIREGEVLAVLDMKQEHAQLAAAEAQRDLAQINFERMEGLLNERVISRAEYDRAQADRRQADARVGEIHAAIDRKTIKAPFSGVLGIRHVNLGQYLSGGDALVTLQALNPIYVNFGVPQQAIGQVRAGRSVRVSVGDLGGAEFTGQITAIDSVVDEATRNVQAQATFANPGAKLHPGMFVQAAVVVGASDAVISLPASAIQHAPFGDSVFVVGDLQDQKGKTYRGVRQQFVKVGVARGDQISIVTGLKAGDEVVTSGVFKLRNGAAVRVNNTVRPGNNPSPKPENS
jgi:membrane fusion protein (multidrug efflux system)